MAERSTRIIGVDFSGAVADNKTWYAQGQLRLETLYLEECFPIDRRGLINLLKGSSGPLVASLDFPFGVPKDFAEYWACQQIGINFSSLQEAWTAASNLTIEEFRQLRKDFIRENKWPKHSGPKRRGDQMQPKSYSPLATSPNDMVPMTFYGMKMLHELNESGMKFFVPPLPNNKYKEDRRTLLEVMPRTVLGHLRLDLPYKSGETIGSATSSRRNRKRILTALSFRSKINISGLDRFYRYAVNFDDCLDAIVAAVSAAMWERCKNDFRQPTAEENEDALMEGWLYSP